MRNGQQVARLPSLIEIREFYRQQIAELPPPLRTLRAEESQYPVCVSDRVRALANSLDASGE